ncbi:NADH-quinone oxidoreductase subunit H [Bdellovibrionota bacterium FG-2]
MSKVLNINLVVHLLTLIIAPVFAIGVINRTKAIWAGRKGPQLNQFYFDLRRLLRKTPVYSETSSWIFQLAPWIVLVTTFLATFLSPIVPGFSPISFSNDFVYFAYLLGLGRFFLILGAIDTGSSFEGMGASREATYSALIEPAFFFAVGTLAISTGFNSFHSLIIAGQTGELAWPIRFGLFLALFVLLQIEAARMPIDDPNTHLELTMIHEVMILDHSGPELAAVQYGSAMKLVLIAGVISALLNPFDLAENTLACWFLSLAIIAGITVIIGLVESLIARLRMKTVSSCAIAGVLAGATSLLSLVLLHRGHP